MLTPCVHAFISLQENGLACERCQNGSKLRGRASSQGQFRAPSAAGVRCALYILLGPLASLCEQICHIERRRTRMTHRDKFVRCYRLQVKLLEEPVKSYQHKISDYHDVSSSSQTFCKAHREPVLCLTGCSAPFAVTGFTDSFVSTPLVALRCRFRSESTDRVLRLTRSVHTSSHSYEGRKVTTHNCTHSRVKQLALML